MECLHVQEDSAALAREPSRPRSLPRPPEEHDPRASQWRQLAESITTRIRAEAHGGTRNLEVRVEATLVRLCGHCSTFYCKQLAQHAALAVIAETAAAADGIQSTDVEVINEIQVW